MPNLNPRELAEIQRRELRNEASRAAAREHWGKSAEAWQEAHRPQQDFFQRSEWVWKRGPVEVLLRYGAQGGLTMQIRINGDSEVRLELARFDQKLIFDHVRHAIGLQGRETRENGALVGLKMLYVNGRDLRSPSRHTPWTGVTLTADHPPGEHDRHGIYALWPARKEPYRIYSELHQYHDLDRGVLARVLGTGRCVVGTKGWRAEHCMVTDLWTTPKRIYQLEHFKLHGVNIHDWDIKHGHR